MTKAEAQEFIESLDPELVTKIKNCKSQEEAEQLLKDAGVELPLDDDALDDVSGGFRIRLPFWDFFE